MFGISSLIVISCISDGFNDVINDKLSGIDGHIRIKSYLSDEIRDKEINILDSLIIDKINTVVNNTASYIEKYAIIRNGSHSEGVILYGVPEKSLNNIFQLNKFTGTEAKFDKNNSIIIGNKLAELLGINKDDDIIILNPEKIVSTQLLNAEILNVANIFQTDFPEYDKLLAFVSVDKAKNIFNMTSKMSGLIININNLDELDNVNNLISEVIGPLPYITTTWEERHESLLEWLNIYDIPIKLIMFFISAVGIFNIAATLWMIIIEKTKEYGILQSLGMTKSQVKEVIIKEGAIIGLSGSLLGAIFSYCILYIESVYHIIKIESVYKKGSYLGVDIVYDEIYQRLKNLAFALRLREVVDSLKLEFSVTIDSQNIRSLF